MNDLASRISPEATVAAGVVFSFVGGFLDAFTYVGHGGVFANAQTGNVVLAGIAAVSGEWAETFRHAPPIAAFFLGAFVVRAIRRAAPRRRWHPAVIALIVETAILVAMLPLPAATPDFWVVVAVSFAASLQFAGFTTVGGWAYTSIATTGNLRRLAEALFASVMGKSEPGAARRARAFGMICLAFFIGAMIGAFLTRRFDNFALTIPAGCLIGILVAIGLDAARRRADAQA